MEPGNKVEVPHRRDQRKKLPVVYMSSSIGGENRFAIFAGDQIRRDRRIKSSALTTFLYVTHLRVVYVSIAYLMF